MYACTQEDYMPKIPDAYAMGRKFGCGCKEGGGKIFGCMHELMSEQHMKHRSEGAENTLNNCSELVELRLHVDAKSNIRALVAHL